MALALNEGFSRWGNDQQRPRELEVQDTYIYRNAVPLDPGKVTQGQTGDDLECLPRRENFLLKVAGHH